MLWKRIDPNAETERQVQGAIHVAMGMLGFGVRYWKDFREFVRLRANGNEAALYRLKLAEAQPVTCPSLLVITGRNPASED